MKSKYKAPKVKGLSKWKGKTQLSTFKQILGKPKAGNFKNIGF